MKIVYIGTSDALAEAFVERMGQEGNDVYLLSDKNLPRNSKSVFKHRFYRSAQKGEGFEKLLRSIAPDCVVYAGNYYMSSIHREEFEADVILLGQSLRAASRLKQVKFILLSSTDVYGDTPVKADETRDLAPAGERGIRFMREEQLLEIYWRQYSMDAVILRVSQLYADKAREGGDDFLSRNYTIALHQTEGHLSNRVFQPLHVSDLVDAIKRVADLGRQHVYNVCGSTEVSAERLYQLFAGAVPERAIQWGKPRCVTLADNGLMKRELEWSDFRDLEALLAKGEISFQPAPEEKPKEKRSSFPAGVRRLIENVAVFAAFFALNSICRSHSLFSQIDWLMIYVILISLSFGIRQSSLAVILASIAYLSGRDLSILEMSNFYSYAGSVLAIMEFVFLGLIVSYTTDMLKEELRSCRLDLKMLREEHEDLKAIDEENVFIKNEYEDRLLASKSGFPRLYHLVSRLMVQEPDRIFMELMQVVSDLVHTDTVAVYRVKEDSPYLRLINALGEGSAMDGRSWNLSSVPRIYDAVKRGELYQGEIGSGEPAVVLPIRRQGTPAAVVVIRTLPYESETLYHMNLLKTMALLLEDSIGRALEYETASRAEHYLEGSDILKPEAFQKHVLLAREKAEKRLAEFCVIKLTCAGNLTEAGSRVASKLRETDYLGIDASGNLCALLNNTGPGDLEPLMNRLRESGVEARLAADEPVEA